MNQVLYILQLPSEEGDVHLLYNIIVLDAS